MSQPKTNVYRTARMRSTPFPNRLLELMITLPETQARLIAVVVRCTLGWYGGSPGTRRSSAHFGYADLLRRVGRSSRDTVAAALEALAQQGVVEATDDGHALVPLTIFSQSYRRGIRLRIAARWVEDDTE